ncbi:hypothetical protein G3T14_20540 [Methylobacterium sp. BTF04]|uniref:hypothetical protein n=1 Tax=Methylobacterium sp. BTF04 TaxID=2708300 RepID=UPI0013D08427|nr:hypothetical protein [Methylobacterium sp. BTF04]NEU14491.1 hypothetical protein [Methylobacterium sp. BTF04]
MSTTRITPTDPVYEEEPDVEAMLSMMAVLPSRQDHIPPVKGSVQNLIYDSGPEVVVSCTATEEEPDIDAMLAAMGFLPST